MLLRLKTGRYAGEVREVPFVVARDLLAQGRAENPFAQQPVAEKPAQIAKVTRKAGGK
jgi:hypothetical protein